MQGPLPSIKMLRVVQASLLAEQPASRLTPTHARAGVADNPAYAQLVLSCPLQVLQRAWTRGVLCLLKHPHHSEGVQQPLHVSHPHKYGGGK